MSKEDKKHDLFDFMSQISAEMASEYERIQKRATEDPGTAGDQGEENWAALLRDWLPSSYHIVTKGRIISQEGKTSPQIDVLVLKPSYPKKLLNKKIYLAAGITAAFECKVTLKSSHITEAIKNCVDIKSLYPIRNGTPYKELHAPIVFGLLAHSHSWKSDNSTPIENIENKIIEDDEAFIDHPRKMIDFICVADLATWVSSKIAFIQTEQDSGSARTAYIGHTRSNKDQVSHFTPVGVLISYLSQKIAWGDQEFRELADYYRITNISGSGKGSMRMWDSNIYSSSVKINIEKGKISNGVPWDEWSIHFS